MSSWASHNWISLDGRVLEIAGRTLRHYTCASCGRAFVEEIESRLPYAVHVGLADFDRLSDNVTYRWITTNCPGKIPPSDEEDRRTRFLATAPHE
jgi:hypothetical protein